MLSLDSTLAMAARKTMAKVRVTTAAFMLGLLLERGRVRNFV